MTQPFNQYVFPPLFDEKGKDKGHSLNLRAKTPEQRKIVERRYARALGYKIENPGASNYKIAKHLRETVWPEAKQRTAEAFVRRAMKNSHWIGELKARGIPT